MRLFRLKPFTGPKHYIFKDPDRPDHIYESKTRDGLIKQIVSYRAQNELPPIQHLSMVLENFWANLPENAENAEITPPLKRGFLAYLKGGIALLDYVFYGENAMVSQEEAERRAKICLSCPFNTFPDKGAFIDWSDRMAEACVGDKKTSVHADLGNCEVCSCTLKSKVFYKGPFRCSKEEMERFPQFCWQRHECAKGNKE